MVSTFHYENSLSRNAIGLFCSKTVNHLHSFPKETQHFLKCLSFGEECMPVKLELYTILALLIKTLYVRVSDPGAPGKMDRLMLRFFWKRV